MCVFPCLPVSLYMLSRGWTLEYTDLKYGTQILLHKALKKLDSQGHRSKGKGQGHKRVQTPARSRKYVQTSVLIMM